VLSPQEIVKNYACGVGSKAVDDKDEQLLLYLWFLELSRTHKS
jgi:hypothetical protein